MVPGEVSYSEQTWRRIEALIGRTQVDPQAPPPVAVFDADGTLWSEDIGEDFFRWQIKEKVLLGADYGRDLFADYVALCERDRAVGYGSLGTIMAGLEEEAVAEHCEAFFADQYTEKIFGAQRTLIETLHAASWQCWIVSGSHRWIIEPGGGRLGIPAERCIGVEVATRRGVLTDKLSRAVTCDEGKVTRIDAQIRRRPLLAAGNSMADAPMLESALGLAVVVNPDSALESWAGARGWLIERWG